MYLSQCLFAVVFVGSTIAAPSPTSPTRVEARQSNQEPCAAVASLEASWQTPTGNNLIGNQKRVHVPISLAQKCLESVPLDANKAQAYLDYYLPYLNFQSTLTYLKSPPKGWTLDAVDVIGGIGKISENIKGGIYKSEWAFENDVNFLVNVLQRDYHAGVPLPLAVLFTVSLGIPPVASVSLDGKTIPQPYVVSDLIQLRKAPNSFKISPIKTINGEPASDFMLRLGLDDKQYHDPDAIYNLVYSTLPLEGDVGDEPQGKIYQHGFNADKTSWTFENGTSQSKENYATPMKSFKTVKSGLDVYSQFVAPPKGIAAATKINARQAQTSVQPGNAFPSKTGFPTPVIGDPDGKTAGYFLKEPNSNVAVLDITAFTDEEKTKVSQIAIIQQFLALAKSAGKTKMVVDLQNNGGGVVGNGYQTFGAFFPSDKVLGATRQRSTPMTDFISNIATTMDKFKTNLFNNVGASLGSYSITDMIDANNQKFKTYKDFNGPNTIAGDNFTAIDRPGNGGKGFGGGSAPDVLPDMDIVLLQDGTCGSTCALFSQLMKSQGGVRSVAVGGRAKTGPMQGVAGTKGAQVLGHKEIRNLTKACYDSQAVYSQQKLQYPSPQSIPAQYNVTLVDPPIGPSELSGRFNLKNNYNSTNADEIPLEFVYEATNCRIYFEPSDLFDISGLWGRVADRAWGGKQCVEGSTTKKEGTISRYAYETVAFTDDAKSKFTVGEGVLTKFAAKV